MAVQYGTGADGNLAAFTAGDTIKSAYSSSVGAGGSLLIWTPASGKKFRLNGFTIGVDTAGYFALAEEAVPFAYIRMAAGSSVMFSGLVPGYTASAANGRLYVQNLNGAVIGISGLATGTEV